MSAPKLLVLQRALYAALAAVMVASLALLLWLERGTSRGAPAREGDRPSTSPTTLARPDAPSAGPASRADSPTSERTLSQLASEPEIEAAEEGFDPSTVRGRVVADDGPLAGVELWLFPGWQERRERRAPLARQRTGENGRFAFRGCEAYASYVLCLQHPDYLPSQETLFPGHAEELELEPAASVSGVVRSAETRTPLAGVRIGIARWHLGENGPAESFATESDAEGRFRLAWAEPGIERFLVQRAGCLPEEREFQVGEEGGEGYEILLSDVSRLELEVVGLESGAVLANTELLCDQARVVTDERGHLRLAAVPGGSSGDPVRLSLALENGCVTQGRVDPAGVHGFLRVPLARGGTIQGRVLDSGGAGVAEAAVRVSGGGRLPSALVIPDGFWLNPPRGVARSAADGSFELRGLPPREGQLELRAQHPAFPPGRSDPFWLATLGASAQVDVHLARGGAVEGRVRLDGEPAALRVFWSAEGGAGWTRANDQGDYRIEGLPSGDVSLRARLDHEDEDVERPEDLLALVEEGKTVRADFELARTSAWIRGRVLDARGEPVARAEVRATPSEEDAEWFGEEPRTESEADGTFALAVPERSGLAFDVWAESGPRRAHASGVPVGDEHVELVLPALTTLSLRVVDALRREPVSGFQLYWRESDEGEFERLVQGGRRFAPGPDGTFLAELPSLRLDLAVSARSQGYVYASRKGLDLFGPAPQTLTFELERGVELTLVLTLAESTAGALAQLQRGRVALASEDQLADRERGGDFFQQEVRNAQALRFDTNNQAVIPALAPGRYRFLSPPKGFEFEPPEFELPAVAQHRLELTLVAAKKKQPNGARD